VLARAADLWSFWNELVDCGRDIDALLALIARRAAEIVGEGSVIAVTDDDGASLRPVALHHPDPQIAELMRAVLSESRSAAEGIAGAVIKSRSAVVYNNLDPDVVKAISIEAYHAFHDMHQIRSMVIVPMIAFGEIVGSLGVFRSTSTVPYDTEDVIALEALAERAALALADAHGRQRGGEPIDHAAIFRHSIDGVIVSDAFGRVVAANPAACEILQRTEAELCAVGRNGLVPLTDQRVIDALETRERTGRVRCEVPMIRGDGSTFYADVASTLFAGDDGELHAIVIFRDVSSQVALREELQEKSAALARLAEEDELTKLRNRRGYFAAARQSLAFADREGMSVQLLYFDVDGLKRINDTFGHHMGDLVLQEIGIAISRHARAIDVVARIGGDEFVALLYGATAEDADGVVARINDAIGANDFLPPVSITSGCASRSPGEDVTVDDLMRAADDQMYARRRAQRNAPPG